MQIGIIAGAGELPAIIARDARARGYRIVTAALEGIAEPALDEVADTIKWVNVGRLGDLIDILKDSGVTEAIMAGKVSKTLLYKTKITPDLRAMKLLFSIKDRSDDSLLRAIAKELQKEGISIVDTASFSPHLLTPEGLLSRRPLTEGEWKDIRFGWKIAKEIGKLDIGQTIVVKNRAVMAVEAIEGTDEAILRGGHWAGEGAVVVKVSKPQQDMRLDVPVIGLATIASMGRVGATVLALESGRSMVINREAVIAEADRAGVTVIGVSADDSSAAKDRSFSTG